MIVQRCRRSLAAVVVGVVVAGTPPAGARLAGAPPPVGADLVLAEPSRLLATAVVPRDADALMLRDVLGNATRYALNDWWSAHMTGMEPYGSMQRTLTSEELRRFSSVALELAVALVTQAYDETAGGMPVEQATVRAADLVRYVVRTHRANTPIGWGGSWQSPLWTATAGHAGWLLGDALAPHDRALLARMLEYEADRLVARSIHYYRDQSGQVLTPGNTGAEDTSYEALALFVAVELLPHHRSRTTWARSAYERMIAAYARPSDLASRQVVNGQEVADWLDGSNAEEDGLVYNHHRVYPDYMACVTHNLAAATVAAMVGGTTPEAARFNARLVYTALVRRTFPVPPFLGPGGTIYVRNSGRIYYPQGTTWGSDRHIVFATLDAQVAALGIDKGTGAGAKDWMRRHLDVVRTMQARGTTGQTYQPGDDDRYALREEQVGLHVAWAYLTHWVAANGMVRWDTSPPETKTPQDWPPG